MAYSEPLAYRIRERLSELELNNVEEKAMMGGLVFMIDDKMCIGIIKDEMMCRIDPELHESLVEIPGCRTMDFTSRPMKGYVLVEPEALKSQKDFNYWVDLCLDFNPRAKSSNKKK